MKCVPAARLSDGALICELKASVADDCVRMARQVELIAEVRARKLYRSAGYESMYMYCIGELGLSEDAAYKRTQVARASRRCPEVIAALRDGRVHLTGLNVMAKHLTPENVAELLASATRKTRSEIERLIAERFPKPDLPARVIALVSPTAPGFEPAVGSCDEDENQPQSIANTETELAPGQVRGHVILGQLPPETPARVAPLASQRYGVQFTFDDVGHELLRHVQDMLGHQVPRSDLAEVFVRALKAYAAQLEREKFAATQNPRPARCPTPGSRHIPAHVKRAVRERDGEQCTFVSNSGHRCKARSNLEYDHVLEHARGGEPTVSGIQLRCRAHNQLTAEQTYGAVFMQHKRDAALAARTHASAV